MTYFTYDIVDQTSRTPQTEIHVIPRRHSAIPNWDSTMSNSIVGIWFSRKLFPVVARAYAEPIVTICKYHLFNNASVWYSNQWLLTLLLSYQCYRQLTPEVMVLSMFSFFFSQHNLKTPCCFQDKLAWHKQQFLTFGDIMFVFIFGGGGGGASFCNISMHMEQPLTICGCPGSQHAFCFNTR